LETSPAENILGPRLPLPSLSGKSPSAVGRTLYQPFGIFTLKRFKGSLYGAKPATAAGAAAVPAFSAVAGVLIPASPRTMAASDSTSRRLTAERRELKRVSLHGNNHAFVEVAPKAMLTAADLNERIADASMIS